MALQINKDKFETEVIKNNIPVIVDFFAEWCGPCKMFAPILDQLSEEYEGKIKIIKIDIDTEPELAAEYNIMSIPTIVFFNNGKVANRHVGLMPKDMLIEKVKEVFNK